jgi:K+-sensing histidine kinase KdpD
MTPMTRDDRWMWSALGVFGAIALSIALLPLRAVTSASNLAFAFIILTVVIAELGGRGPALATAVVSAMSLNFFLTVPYLTLMIHNPDDIVAFAALALSGLIVAAFGRRRERSSELAARSMREIDALKQMVSHLEAGATLDRVLEDLRAAFELGRLVVRNASGTALAASPPGAAPPAAVELDPDTLLARDDRRHQWSRAGFRLPEGGGRVSLRTDRGPLSLDLWEGAPEGLSAHDRRALSIAASILAMEIARRQPAP